MVDVGKLRKVVEEIENGVFRWNQQNWIDSSEVPSGLSEDRFRNECKTSFCVAGRIATLFRDILYYRDRRTGEFYASPEVVALEGDSVRDGVFFSGDEHYAVSNKDGKMVFEAFEGCVISARNAAVADLGIGVTDSWNLFDSDNDLDTIKEVVNQIIETHEQAERVGRCPCEQCYGLFVSEIESD